MGNTLKIENRVRGRCPACGYADVLYLEPTTYTGPGEVKCGLIGCTGPDLVGALLERSREAWDALMEADRNFEF